MPKTIVPLDKALAFYKKTPKDFSVRAYGLDENVEPTSAVYYYHVDTMEGLIRLAELIKEVNEIE